MKLVSGLHCDCHYKRYHQLIVQILVNEVNVEKAHVSQRKVSKPEEGIFLRAHVTYILHLGVEDCTG